VTMNAREIAKLADVDLEDLRFRMPERQIMLGQLSREGVVGGKIHTLRRMV
jgi:hypothetical protein